MSSYLTDNAAAYNCSWTVPLGGVVTLQAPNSASSFTWTLPSATGTLVVTPIATKLTWTAYNNSSSTLGDFWFDSITQAFMCSPGAAAQGQDQYVPGVLWALKVPVTITTAKNAVYVSILTPAGQTYNGTNTLKANYLTAGKHIDFELSGILTLATGNSTISAKLQIGGVDLVTSTSASTTFTTNIPWRVCGMMQCQVLGGGANSTINGIIKLEINGGSLVIAYGQLTNVTATGTLVVDVLMTTAQNNLNTITPLTGFVESLG